MTFILEYAPWASASITVEAQPEGVGCIIHQDTATGEVSYHMPGEAQAINHWVACLRTAASQGDIPPDIDESGTDETVTFAAQYLSVGGIVLLTVADGNCGLDVMCWMLGFSA